MKTDDPRLNWRASGARSPSVPVRYAVVAFPTLKAPDRVEAVRRRFDPLSAMLDAHITLVFPFEDSPDSDTVRRHITAAAAGIEPFAVTFTDPTIADDGFLFLHVVEGRERIIELHDRLYSGPLVRHLTRTHPYRPHLTVGRLNTLDTLPVAAREARAILTPPVIGHIDSLAFFSLEDDARGSVQFTVALDGSAT